MRDPLHEVGETFLKSAREVSARYLKPCLRYSRTMTSSGNIVLARKTAVRYWLTVDPESPESASRYQGVLVRQGSVRFDLIEHLRRSLLLSHRGDIEVLVPSSNEKRKIAGVRCLISGKSFPVGSFYSLGSSMFVVSPELAYIQMGTQLGLPLLAELGSKLCANYYIDPVTQTIEQRAKPATTPERLSAFVDKLSSARGSDNARRALQWVAAGAESPREISSMLMLSLPYRLGGYGCPKPEINHPITPGRSSGIVGQALFRADLCWPKSGVIVEYDGEEFHQDVHKDKRRINDLEALGWKVFSLSSGVLADTDAFEAFALKVSRQIGHQVRRPNDWSGRNATLRKELRINRWE